MITQSELKAILESAADAANIVPVALQPVAFSKAVDLLVNTARKRSGALQKPTRALGNPIAKARSSLNRPGPKAALEILLGEKYFESDKKEGEIRTFLKDSKGYEYSANELSISLLRLIRKGVLTREKDAEGHYRYKATEN
jgi:hypothetical protein